MDNLHQITGSEPPAALHGMNAPVSQIDPCTLNDWINDGNAFVIDVREPQEYEESRIAGSFLVPMSRFDPTTYPHIPDLKTVLVCQWGMRAIVVAERLHEAGFPDIHILQGGLKAWTEDGFEVEE